MMDICSKKEEFVYLKVHIESSSFKKHKKGD